MVQPSKRVTSPSGRSRPAAATVVRRRDFTDDLFVLWLEPGIRFDFTAGQYITIGAGGFERPYSIVSAPYEPHVELFMEYVRPEHGGKLTPLLHASRAGDRLTMRRAAKGRFTLRCGIRNHVMVATVTGIAPYESMVRQFLHDRETGAGGAEDCRFFVMQGASYHDEFVYDEEFRRLSRQHPGLLLACWRSWVFSTRGTPTTTASTCSSGACLQLTVHQIPPPGRSRHRKGEIAPRRAERGRSVQTNHAPADTVYVVILDVVGDDTGAPKRLPSQERRTRLESSPRVSGIPWIDRGRQLPVRTPSVAPGQDYSRVAKWFADPQRQPLLR